MKLDTLLLKEVGYLSIIGNKVKTCNLIPELHFYQADYQN
jgi:hypothetical protein